MNNQPKENSTAKHLAIKTGIMAGIGAGDALAKFTEVTGLDNLATVYTNLTGKDCGCKKRQEMLNRLFPY